MILPAYRPSMKREIIDITEFCPGVVLKTILVPTWPCYAKDGAGKITNIHFEQMLEIHGKVFRLVEEGDNL